MVALVLVAQRVKRSLLQLFLVHGALLVVNQKKKPRRGCVAAWLAELWGKPSLHQPIYYNMCLFLSPLFWRALQLTPLGGGGAKLGGGLAAGRGTLFCS